MAFAACIPVFFSSALSRPRIKTPSAANRKPAAGYLTSPEEYLAAERLSETKHQYLAGVVYAMAGTSVDHDRIAVNILGELRNQLRGHPYDAFSSDVKVRIESMGSRFYYYSDVTVDCSNVRGDSLFAAVNGASAVNLEPGENGGRREQLTPSSKTCVGDGPDYPNGVRP